MRISTVSNPGFGFSLLALLAIGPAQAADETAPDWRQVAYTCESGQSLTVAYRETGSAIQVTVADKAAVKLVARPANSGFRYSDSRHELRGEGQSITWKVGSRTPVTCTSQDPATAQLAAAAAR